MTLTTAATAIDDRAAELLRELAGPDAAFREHQLEAVRDLVVDRARVLCVQRTGWGKSAVYFLATALGREQGAGPAPRSRSSAVARKYTADLPQPVRCTQSTRARSSTRSRTASS